MKMRTLGGGIGLGLKDFRAVIIFRNREDLEEFVEKGWEFGGEADAALNRVRKETLILRHNQ